MRFCSLLTLCLVLLHASGVRAEAAAPDRSASELDSTSDAPHQLIVLELSDGTLRALVVKNLELPLPGRPVTDSLPWRVQLLDSKGRALHQVSLPSGTQVRGEFPDERGALRPVRFEAPSAGFAVRVPKLESAVVLRLLASRASVLVPPPGGDEFVVLGELKLDRGVPR